MSLNAVFDVVKSTKTRLNRSRQENKFRSLFLFSRTSKIRLFLQRVTSSWQFEYLILFCIIASCVLLSIQGSTRKPYSIHDPFTIADMILNAVFVLEAIAKIVTHGFVMHRGAYLRNGWNFFDFVVVVAGVVTDAMALATNSSREYPVSFKTMRLFRVFRPLRLIARSNNLKVVLDTIIKSFRTILHVLMFIFLIIMLYAITGLELFAEPIPSACVDATSTQLVKPFTTCHLNESGQCNTHTNTICSSSWKGNIENLQSFENIFKATLTVIQVITMEDWVFISYEIAEVVSPFITWIFFVSLILFGSYFAVDLLMGVLGNQYMRTKQFAKTMKVIKSHRQKSSIKTTSEKTDRSISGTTIAIRFRHFRDALQRSCQPIIDTKFFFYIALSFVVVDVIITCVYAYLRDVNDRVPLGYLTVKSVTMFLFLIEMLMVGFGKGLRLALQNGYYVFNSAILVVSSVELFVAIGGEISFVGLSTVRALTLIEVFKHTRFWSQINTIMTSFFGTIKGASSLLLLLFILVANYALLGNQLFSAADEEPGKKTIGTFDTFWSSLLLSFVLLTGDNWTVYMRRELKSATTISMKVFTMIFYISFVFIGFFILMNVFLGIIVDNLTSDFEEQHEVEFEEEKLKSVGLIGKMFKNSSVYKAKTLKSSTDLNETSKENDGDGTSNNIDFPSKRATKKPIDTTMISIRFDVGKGEKNKDSNVPLRETVRPTKLSMPLQLQLGIRLRARAFSLLINPEICNPIPDHKSWFLFGPESELRRKVYRLVVSSKFTLFIGIIIMISVLAMAFYDPLERSTDRKFSLQIIDIILTGLFSLEIILKSIAYGFVFGHKMCYLRNPLNMMDTFVVAVSLANICIDLLGYSGILQLGVLRVLRIVRILKVSSQVKHVLDCLAQSLRKMFYFLVLYMIMLFVYSVIGVHLYKGMIGNCSDIAHTTEHQCVHHNKTWNNNSLTFDDVGAGMITLFVLSTMDEWFRFLSQLISVPDKSDVTAIVFIVSFIIIMSFVIMNVFIGFVIVLFHKVREKEDKFKVLDKSAQDCLRTALSENPVKKWRKPSGKFRILMWQVATSNWFQTVSMILIILNTGFLMTKHAQQNKYFTFLQRLTNILFTILFTIEIYIKLAAFSFRVLLHDYWVTFDVVVIFGSWLDIILDELQVQFINLSIFRLFRVARLAKLVGRGGNLRELFNTFVKSIKCVPSISCLIALFVYFYAILGMKLFGNIRLDSQTAINKNTNFQSFMQSVLVLIRVTTLDAWHEIMLTCADVKSLNCQHSDKMNCGSYLSYLYFASFVFVCSYIMTNLFLAFIMDNFGYLTHDVSTLDERQIHRFTEIWSKFDREGTGSIRKNQLASFLQRLDPPLGCGTLAPLRTVYSKLLRIRVPIELNNQVKFREILLSLLFDLLEIPKSENEKLRDDLQMLYPTIDDDILDRVLPLSYDPRILNIKERKYYQLCASYIISGYYKVYHTSLTAARKMKENHLQPPAIDYSAHSSNTKTTTMESGLFLYRHTNKSI